LNLAVSPPYLLRRFYRNLIWRFPSEEKNIYLTFDDGPIPEATTFVLDELAKYRAKATFFCIGENVIKHRGLFERIKSDGHATGNHTHSHLNGWKTKDAVYFDEVRKANQIIQTNLFRPPYGKIKKSQISFLTTAYSIIMWDVLSFDFDSGITPEKCAQNVIENSKQGSIVVFHDSLKARKNLIHALPATLKYFSEKGFEFKAINTKN
jgi:peptidoglycan-N-acetylglucosamine deacetylase